MKKFLSILGLILGVSLFITGCVSKEALPMKLDLEDSMREIISSKGEDYDFLNDDVYMEHVENLMDELTINDNYALGNLDGDNIPELVIFNEKDSNDVDDEGSLEVYSFNGSEYILLDKVNMGFDNDNYDIQIGKISENQRGLFLNNNIGTNAGVTYGFILENGKLKNILNDKKVSLISIFAENEIKDINNDGILNFSIVTIDPETEDISIDGSDKMTLWYKWDGKDSATLIDVERKDYSKKSSNKNIYNMGKDLISNDFSNSLPFLIENKDKLSKYDLSILIENYIKKLNDLSFHRGTEINELFSKNNTKLTISRSSENFTSNIDNLNSIEYLNREKVLKDNENIKNHLIENINLGFKLNVLEGRYYYLVDYQKFVNLFDGNILNEYMDYLKIRAFNSNEPFIIDGSLVISQDQLIERILYVESFKILYPYSKLLTEVQELYVNYINIYLFGDLHNPNFDYHTKLMKEESLEKLKEVSKNLEFTNFRYIIDDFLFWLEENNNVLDDNIKEKLYNRIN